MMHPVVEAQLEKAVGVWNRDTEFRRKESVDCDGEKRGFWKEWM